MKNLNTLIALLLFTSLSISMGIAQSAITFQVDMSNEVVAAEGVHLAGNFQGWDPAATVLTDDDMDGIH